MQIKPEIFVCFLAFPVLNQCCWKWWCHENNWQEVRTEQMFRRRKEQMHWHSAAGITRSGDCSGEKGIWYRLLAKIDWAVSMVTAWSFLSCRCDCMCPSRDSVVKTCFNPRHKFCHPSKKDLIFYYSCSALMEGIAKEEEFLWSGRRAFHTWKKFDRILSRLIRWERWFLGLRSWEKTSAEFSLVCVTMSAV